MDWTEVSREAWDVMDEFGGFRPTATVADREIQGTTVDEEVNPKETHWDSSDLRRIAAGCLEIAEWLDHRAGG